MSISFLYLFLGHTWWRLGVTPGRLGGRYEMLGIEPGSVPGHLLQHPTVVLSLQHPISSFLGLFFPHTLSAMLRAVPPLFGFQCPAEAAGLGALTAASVCMHACVYVCGGGWHRCYFCFMDQPVTSYWTVSSGKRFFPNQQAP